MKKTAITFAALALLFGTVEAEGMKPYVSFSSGVGVIEDARTVDNSGNVSEMGSKAGFTYGVAAGIALDKVPVRLEVEYFHQENDVDKIKTGGVTTSISGDTSINAGMINVYYDFTTEKSPVIVSLMGGIGLAKMTGDLDMPGVYEDDDTVRAYQVGVGVGFPLSDNLILDAKYAYFTTEDPQLELYKGEVDAHRFTVGLRYSF